MKAPDGRDRRRRLRLPRIASALGFVGLVFYLSEYWISGQPPSLLPAAPSTEPAIALYLVQPRSVSYDEQGQVSHRFRAESMHQLEGTDLSLATQPVFIGYRSDGERWTARSKQGEIRQHGNEVTLVDQVVIDNISGDHSLHTTRLILYPQLKYAETDVAVHLMAPGSVTDGIGLRADLAADRVELLTNVRGRHDVL